MPDPLTPRQIDLLTAGLSRPAPLYPADMIDARVLEAAGLATIDGVRKFKLKTTGDGVVALHRHRAPVRNTAPGMLPAHEINAWLQSLPHLPPMDGDANG